MALFSNIDLIAIIVNMFRASSNFSLVAVPFFILAGGFMDRGGISRRLVALASNLIGHIRGGLANASVVAAMFFAGLSGAAAADTAAVGSLLIPAMKKKGYGTDIADQRHGYGGLDRNRHSAEHPDDHSRRITASVSIGGLFMGGFIPGILMGVALMMVNYLSRRPGRSSPNLGPASKRWGARSSIRFSRFSRSSSSSAASAFGIFTPTEASIIAALYAFIVGFSSTAS